MDGDADEFDNQGVTRPKGCRMSIIEAVWKPDEIKGEPVAVEVQTNGADTAVSKPEQVDRVSN